MKNITLPDIEFVLGMTKVDGTVYMQNNIQVFQSKEHGVLTILPYLIDSITDKKDMAFPMFVGTNIIVQDVKPGITVYTDRMKDYQEDIITDYDMIYEQYEEQKLRAVPKVLSHFAEGFAFLVLAVVLYFTGFIYPLVIASAALSILFFVIYGRSAKVLNQQIVYDANGNWINFADETCSLTDDQKIPGRAKE